MSEEKYNSTSSINLDFNLIFNLKRNYLNEIEIFKLFWRKFFLFLFCLIFTIFKLF